MKKVLLTYTLLLISILSFAASTDFTVKVSSSTVEVGQNFQISFTINTDIDNFSAPTFDNFKVLRGPSYAKNNQDIYGKVTQTTSVSYVLAATRNGTFTIGSAAVKLNGKTLKTKPVKIKVIENNPNGAAAQQNKTQQRKTEAEKLKEYVFVRAIVDKREAYMGEKVTVTYKLYSRLNLNGVELESPTRFTGFWTQELITLYRRNIQKSREQYKGQTYEVVDLQQTVLYPQRSGELTIDGLSIIAKVQVQRQPRNRAEQIWGAYDMKEVIAGSAPIKLKVKPFPIKGKPDSFNGAVGNFKIKMSANKDSLVSNESVNVKIELSGAGNLPLINAPNLVFPPDFEVYDPETKDNVKTDYNGSSGKKTFDYLVIPRHSGEFDLAPYEFSYFDLTSKHYRTIKADPIRFIVAKGDDEENVVFSDRRKEDIELIGTDIRFIHINNLALYQANEFFFGSKLFYLILLAIVLFGVLIVLLAKRNKDILGDKTGLRKSKATKIAKKRLAVANKHLQAKDNVKFYEEISIAIFGYFADKFNLKVADISQEKILELLERNNQPPELKQSVKTILEETEMARFAPESSINSSILYEKSVALIQNLES